MTVRLAIALLAAVLTALAAGPSLAQPQPATAAKKAAASRLGDAAAKLMKQGRPREALAAYMQAHRTAPSAGALTGIAQVYVALGDIAAAHAAYSDLVRVHGEKMRPKELEEAKRGLEDAAKRSGSVRVAVAEPGATITVSGRALGTTPLPEPVRLTAETYKLLIEKPGFVAVSRDLVVPGGVETVVDDALVPERGRLVVVGTGKPGANLIVDGKEVGALPWEGDLPPGKHDLAATGPGLYAAPTTVEVVPGGRAEVTLSVLEETGQLRVETTDPGASVFVDGARVGSAPWEGPLAVGRHDLRVELAGFQPHTGQVTIAKDQRRQERIKLVRVRVAEAKPPPRDDGLYVRVDGEFLVAPVPPDTTVAAECHPGANSCLTQVPLGAGGTLRLGYSLGYFGIEAVGFGSYDVFSAEVEYRRDVRQSSSPTTFGPARDEDYQFSRLGFGGGLGLRASSRTQVVAVSLGAMGGVSHRRLGLQIDAQARDGQRGSMSFEAEGVSYTAPAGLGDITLLFGSSPGVRFTLGARALLEYVTSPPTFAGSQTQQLNGSPMAIPATRAADGLQLVIGPSVGIQID